MIYDRFRNPKASAVSKKPFIFILLFSLVFTSLVWFLLKPQENPNATEYFDISGPSILLGAEELSALINDSVAFNQLRENLTFFAKESIDEYKDSSQQVVFRIDEFSGDKEILINGRYRESQDSISVTLKKLPNSRVSLSINNTSLSFNIDDKLPANNSRNRFIASLPISTDDYVIEFDSQNDKFVVKLYNVDRGELAIETIGNGAEVDTTKESINLIPLGDYNSTRISGQNSTTPLQEQSTELGD